MNKIILFLFLLSSLALTSCDNNRLYERNTPIAKDGWKASDKARFFVTVEDTLTPNTFYINLRNSGTYRYSNIFLFFNTEFPNGKIAHDTIECLLADDKGKWLGKGSGDLYDNRILFKRNVRFPRKGTYKFTIEQAMRIDPLEGISDVGLRIEKQ
jgi:gliding motility-associated lipoprotein GldH